MVEKKYAWEDGAELLEHTRRKHKILREYFHQYLYVRCRLPQQTKFRLAVVDGFSGAGRYSCGTPGSPIIFLEELMSAFDRISIERKSQGLADLGIECLLIFNDLDPEAVSLLKGHCAPLLAEIREQCGGLHIDIQYMNCEFEKAYKEIKERVRAGRYLNVIYNLDQCGHSWVDRRTIVDIMSSTKSVEIIFTFLIEALISYLSKTDQDKLLRRLAPFGINETNIEPLSPIMSKREWLGTAERLVLNHFKSVRHLSALSPFTTRKVGAIG